MSNAGLYNKVPLDVDINYAVTMVLIASII